MGGTARGLAIIPRESEGEAAFDLWPAMREALKTFPIAPRPAALDQDFSLFRAAAAAASSQVNDAREAIGRPSCKRVTFQAITRPNLAR